MPGKRDNRISVFLSDVEVQQLALDADEAHREPADYLRSLWLLERERRAQDLARRLGALYSERQQNHVQHGGSGVQGVSSINAWRGGMKDPRAPVWHGREDAGFPRTVADGGDDR